MGKQTPMMKQYSAIKAQYEGAVLFFRMGDFYEMFYDDAHTASKVLGLTLTSRSQSESERIPLAGFPHHQLENYLAKMVRAGYRVAICEQVEDPKKAKGLVRREVIEVVTAGSAISETVLEKNRNNYLTAIFLQKDMLGFSAAEVSTGEFFAAQGKINDLREEIRHISPSEAVLPLSSVNEVCQAAGLNSQISISEVDDFYFSHDYAEDTLKKHFKVISLRGMGVMEFPLAVSAAGALINYLKKNLRRDCSQFTSLSMMPERQGMRLDPSTIRNLEIFESFSGKKEATLFHVIDRTSTSMGARLLRKWLGRPLTDYELITKRLSAVEACISEKNIRRKILDSLKGLCDMERTLSRLTSGRGNARDTIALRNALDQVPYVREILKNSKTTILEEISRRFRPVDEITDLLQSAIVEEPPFAINEGGIFKQGYNARLDELRAISGSGKDWILNRQAEERKKTGIQNLKIGYNKVFGYYIEITKSNADKAPQDYIRKQTLVNAERYITPELKEYEDRVLRAEDEIKELELDLFNEIRVRIAEFAEQIQQNAQVLAELDVFISNAETAEDYGYCKPEIAESDEIELKDSRHPVVERLLPPGEKFIPNDLSIGGDLRLMLITGPNMAGKSTYLRQAALIVLLAQCGVYVPAKSARIGIIDRIFTRVGAQDNLAEGESTFLLEMNEAANILNHATPKSLIVLDELGRGTSTYDGLSIAWAMTEYLHNTEKLRSKTLFATHYHELTELAKDLPGVENFNILVKEYDQKIVFLRKIAPGACDRSYGIQVARMAGLPRSLIERALEVLASLEESDIQHPERHLRQPSDQLSLFVNLKDELREKFKEISPDELTPKQALAMLYQLKDLI